MSDSPACECCGTSSEKHRLAHRWVMSPNYKQPGPIVCSQCAVYWYETGETNPEKIGEAVRRQRQSVANA